MQAGLILLPKAFYYMEMDKVLYVKTSASIQCCHKKEMRYNVIYMYTFNLSLAYIHRLCLTANTMQIENAVTIFLLLSRN